MLGSGLRTKFLLASGLYSQNRIRAPVSKMIGLWAPQQKFHSSRAPPPLWDPEYYSKTDSDVLIFTQKQQFQCCCVVVVVFLPVIVLQTIVQTMH